MRIVATGHDTDRNVLFLHQRVLLDMQLEIGIQVSAADGRVTQVTDTRQLVAIADAVIVLQIVQPFGGLQTREDAGRRHRRREPRALLVGPVDHFDRPFRDDPVVVQGAQYLQARQNPQNPVEAPARRLAVEMAADHDRRQSVVLPGPAGEDAASGVDGNHAADCLAPFDILVAHFFVAVGQGQPPQPAFRSGADFGRPVERGP